MSGDLNSFLVLRIQLPEHLPGDISYSTSNGQKWTQQRDEPDSGLNTEGLWREVVGRSDDDLGALREAGRRLGDWLLDGNAKQTLQSFRRTWEAETDATKIRGRVELFASRDLSSWPWELADLPGVGYLGACACLTLVRRRSGSPTGPLPKLRRTTLNLVGVRHSATNGYQELATEDEVHRLQLLLQDSPWAKKITISLDTQGKWDELKAKFLKNGAPAMFHFAGHGMENGRGLVFQGPSSRAQEVSSDAIVSCLADQPLDRRARLVFLNACYTAEARKAQFQPFGSIADQLVESGIPCVVGSSAKITNDAALRLAWSVYSSLVTGKGIDVAVQDARRELHTDNNNLSWPFVTLNLSVDPEELMLAPSSLPPKKVRLPSNLLLDFGYHEQLSKLQVLLAAGEPSVFLIHGPVGAGHKHLIRQIVRSAGQRHRLYEPIPEFMWLRISDPKLVRHQLLGVLGAALGLPDDSGQESDLIHTIAASIVSRCDDFKAMMLYFSAPIELGQPGEVDALCMLVEDLWIQIISRARQLREDAGKYDLPVFLLLPLRYPDEESLPEKARAKAQGKVELAMSAVKRLGNQSIRQEGLFVRVLPSLTRFSVADIEDFLSASGLYSQEEAKLWAEERVGLADNETILEDLEELVRREATP